MLDGPPQLSGLGSVVSLATDIHTLVCVLGENKVARFDRLMTRKTSLVFRYISWFAVFSELSETPAACPGVLLGVLDHKLKILFRSLTRYIRLGASEDLIVLLRRGTFPSNPGYD